VAKLSGKVARNRLLVAGVLIGGSVAGAEFIALSPWGHPSFLIWKGLVILVAVGAFLATIVEMFKLVVALVRRCERNDQLNVFVGRLAFFLLLVGGVYTVRSIRDFQFEMLSTRSEPLIAAVNNYTSKHGAPPLDLDALEPEYISEVPTTRISAYPDYSYFTPGRYGNPWTIEVYTYGMDPDVFSYLPKQNYEEIDHGKWKRIGAWAYIVD